MKEAIARLKRSLDARDGTTFLATLAEVSRIEPPLSAQFQLAKLAVRSADATADLPEVRIAFCADATLDDLVAMVSWRLLLAGWRLVPLILPFGTWPQQVHAADSSLYAFRPDVVWLFTDPARLGEALPGFRSAEQAERESSELAAELEAYGRTVVSRCGALVVVNNIVPPAWGVLGNLDSQVAGALVHTALKFNARLPAALPMGCAVFDLAHLASSFGLARWEDPRLWCHSKHPFALDAHLFVANAMASVILAAKGRSRKCVVLDLDNTLWGGVIGDDGLDGIVIGKDEGAVGQAFALFQSWLKALTTRGILLAVCSKNDEVIARSAFSERSGMVLRLSDFAAFRANWGNKADNLRDIAQELNLGLDSFVFVDDNPAEREQVRRELPQVAVPELPRDASDYVQAVARGGWFETLAVSEEDRSRASSYRANAERTAAAAVASDLPTYMRDLAMTADWGVVDDSTAKRFTQLVNKTNQFHPTTTRYSEAQVQRMRQDECYWLGHFSLTDRFGDYGIIASTVLRVDGQVAIIDAWAMSCRVFSRTMENFIFAVLVSIARGRNCTALRASYLPTPKNRVVANLYADLGGVCEHTDEAGATVWVFDLVSTKIDGSPFIAHRHASPVGR